MKREIKFDYVVLNIHFHEISHVVLTLEDIENKGRTPSWIWTDNCDVLAKRQYTGLNDKNGKEIYEGDIIKCHRFVQMFGEGLGVYEGEVESICEVSIFSEGLWLESNTEDNSGFTLHLAGLHEESYEIIGNIYETPNLL